MTFIGKNCIVKIFYVNFLITFICRFISGSYDVPAYILHYKTDVPLSIRALLYFPEGKPGKIFFLYKG